MGAIEHRLAGGKTAVFLALVQGVLAAQETPAPVLGEVPTGRAGAATERAYAALAERLLTEPATARPASP